MEAGGTQEPALCKWEAEGRKVRRLRILTKLCSSAFVFDFLLSRVALLPRLRASVKKERRITKKCLTGDGALARAKETPKWFSGGRVGSGKNVCLCRNYRRGTFSISRRVICRRPQLNLNGLNVNIFLLLLLVLHGRSIPAQIYMYICFIGGHPRFLLSPLFIYRLCFFSFLCHALLVHKKKQKKKRAAVVSPSMAAGVWNVALT